MAIASCWQSRALGVYGKGAVGTPSFFKPRSFEIFGFSGATNHARSKNAQAYFPMQKPEMSANINVYWGVTKLALFWRHTGDVISRYRKPNFNEVRDRVTGNPSVIW
jgi:hypothetical protein